MENYVGNKCYLRTDNVNNIFLIPDGSSDLRALVSELLLLHDVRDVLQRLSILKSDVHHTDLNSVQPCHS